MPAVDPNVIVSQIINSIQISGGSAAYVSSSVRTHPRKFAISYSENTYSLWVYIWTLTHGGRASLPDEFRIQMTSVSSPLPMNPNGITVLMGYHADLGVFAGFDLQKHSTFTVGSPSVQINISALHSALQNGISFSTKDNDEIAIGIRPDNFLNYCLNSEVLHSQGSDREFISLLSRAVSLDDLSQDDISLLSVERKKVVERVTRYYRNANFKKLVMNAYDNRCAVTRAQLRLVDAAHILPVAAEESSDHVTNGLALSPTLHRAYDNSLIYLDENYIIKLNSQKANELRGINLDGGLDQLCSLLDQPIHLPIDPNQRPNPEYIRKANKYRRIPGYA